MTDPTILQYLRSIEEKIDNGFDDVGKRLDGHQDAISSLNLTRAEQQGSWKVIVCISAVVSTVVGFIASWMGKG